MKKIKMPFEKENVLVTGASGFIGSHLCAELIRMGAIVHGISRKSRSNRDDGIRWWYGDLVDSVEVEKMVQAIKPGYVFHLASHVVGARTLEQVLPTFSANLQSAVNLLTALTECGCRKIVMVGSQEEPDRQDVEDIPSSPYAAAKWSASAYARMFHALYGTPVSIARVYMVYGPGQQDLSKLIPYVTIQLLKDEVPGLSSGTRPIDWIYVADVVSGLLSIATSEDTNGQTIEIGSGGLISIKDIVMRLAAVVGSKAAPSFGSVADRPMEQIRKADVQITYDQIGWKPKTSLEDGLRKTVDWYRELLKTG
jgi:UDP-glucose 4-epimerase